MAGQLAFLLAKARLANVLLADLTPNLKTVLIEEYSEEVRPYDGEIYRKIRGHQLEGNSYFEKRWWARLSRTSPLRRERLE